MANNDNYNPADNGELTEIDFNDLLQDSSGEPGLYDGFSDDVKKKEEVLSDNLTNLYDEIMSSGPSTIVPKPFSVIASETAAPAEAASDKKAPENTGWESDYDDLEIPVVALEEPVKETAPAEESQPKPGGGPEDIFSMINSLKAETENHSAFTSILSEIESNSGIRPIDDDISSAASLVSDSPAVPVSSDSTVYEDFTYETVKAEPDPAPAPASKPVSPAADDGFGYDAELEAMLADDLPPVSVLSDNLDDIVVDIPAEKPVQDIFEVNILDIPDEPEPVSEPVPEAGSAQKKKEKKKASKEETPEKAPEEDKESSGSGEVIRKIVLTVSIIVIIISSGVLVNTYLVQPYLFKKQAEEIVNTVDSENTEVAPAAPVEGSGKKYPEGMLMKYAGLYDINEDVAGWISIPGLGINLAVAQGDDNEYYLRRDIRKKRVDYGVPYFDYRMTDLKNLHQNNIVYGHNMRHDDLIFGMLENYRNIKYFQENPVIECNTIYGDHTWFVCAVFITNSKAAQDNGYVFPYNFIDVSEYKLGTYIEEISKRSLYNTGVDMDVTDKFLTLSTCCYDFDDARLVVVAREKRENESSSIDVYKAYKNENPKYPQAWYDANNKENPYANDYRW